MWGCNGLLTAMIGREWKVSAATGESSLANSGRSQSNIPGNMQSSQIGYFGTLYREQRGAKPAVVAFAACKIHISVKLSQQGVSIVGACNDDANGQTSFYCGKQTHCWLTVTF